MSFVFYDLTFLVVFCLFLIFFLRKRRKNLKREGLLYLYKTKIGIKFIGYIGKKYKKTLGVLQYVSIALGYVLMVGVFLMLLKVVYTYLKSPEITEVIKAPPLVPLIPYFPNIFGVQSFFPPFYFAYFIISILIVATVHEFSHGIFAKAKGLKIKSTGFAFLGPFIGAFVEQDEKQMFKKPKIAQMGILSAGVFANVITAGIFILLAWGFLSLTFVQAGMVFNGYALTSINVSSIESIGNYNIENVNADKILDLIENEKMEGNFSVSLDGKSINLAEIKADGGAYLLSIEDLKAQLEIEKSILVVYGDFPAIRNSLRGTIIELNGVKIRNQEDLSKELVKYKPEEEVVIKTKFNDTAILTYNLRLAESPNGNDKAFLGISSVNSNAMGFRSLIYKFFNFFEEPSTALEPKFNGDLMTFIKDLLWWIIIINFLVALFNMLPVGMLDGGRFFYLTILSIVKNEKIAGKISKFMLYLILLILLMMMVAWFIALF